MSKCEHKFQEIDIRIPTYFILPIEIIDKADKEEIPYSVKCICLKCSNTYIIDQNGEIV